MPIRVLLVDDHQIMLEGLRAMLAGEPDFEVVGEANNGRIAVELARRTAPEVVVMDVGMPEMNGIDATHQIKAENPRVKVVALSMHSTERYVHHMLLAGASGYVLKSSSHVELVRALRAARAGKVYLSPEIAGPVVERSTHPDPTRRLSPYSTLGPREREVLQLVAEGRTSAETARQMGISIKTVETHRRNIVQKLGLHGTAELTKYAVREGLTSLEA
jgi:DNA-binding NarL/FixJ family response regulator